MIYIKKYTIDTEGNIPKLLETFTINQYADSITSEIEAYRSRLGEHKGRKTFAKIESKMLNLVAYRDSILNSSNSIEDLSYVMSTSFPDRYRVQNTDGSLSMCVYESDGFIFWDFEKTKGQAPVGAEVVKKEELDPWKRLEMKIKEFDEEVEDGN